MSQEQELDKRSGPIPIRKKSNFYGLNIDRRAIPGVQSVIVVASGKGGVGKSTVSTNLAVALGKTGKRVGLLDADIYGPSAPMMLGLGGTLQLTDDNKLIPKEAHGIKTMSFGFLTDHYHPVIWRGPMISKALQQLFYDVAWGELDYLVVDLPPGTGDIQLTLIERLPIHGALIVTTPQDIALLDAHKALSMFSKLEVNVMGVVENMSHFACPHCGGDVDIFGHEGVRKFSEERRLPILTRIPLNRDIRMKCDAGTPVAAQEDATGVFQQLAALIHEKIEVLSFV